MKYLNCANHVNSDNQPETLITMIDMSGSMEEKDIKPSRIIAAINANQEIIKVKQKHHSNDNFGVISFQNTAKFSLLPTTPGAINDLKQKINESGLIPGTDFTAPLQLAYEYFSRKPKSVVKKSFSKMISSLLFEPTPEPSQETTEIDTVKRIILLTDGEHLGDSNPNDIATKLKEMGVIIDCIGIGGCPENVDEKLLKQIASRNPDGSIRYCFIGDHYKLLQKYRTLARHITTV